MVWSISGLRLSPCILPEVDSIKMEKDHQFTLFFISKITWHGRFPFLIFPLNRTTQLIFPESRWDFAKTGKLV